VISSTQRPLLDNTQRSQETTIHAPGRNQTHNPSKRDTAEPDLKPLTIRLSLQTSQTFYGLKHVLKPTACNVPIRYKIEARSCNQCWSGKTNNYYIFCVCACSLSYPACNAHAPHCHLWPVRLFSIFPHYLKKARFWRKKKDLL